MAMWFLCQYVFVFISFARSFHYYIHAGIFLLLSGRNNKNRGFPISLKS